MTTYQALVAEREDIAMVTVLCTQCESSLSLKIETARSPVRCPSCGKDYDQNIEAALAALRKFHAEANKAEVAAQKPIFRFEVRFHEKESESPALHS